MNKKDAILIFVLIIAAGILFLLKDFRVSDTEKAKAVIYEGDKKIQEILLTEEKEMEINGTNRLLIKDGKATMIWADCPDKLCVHQKSVSKKGETIVCLPNKIIVEVQ